MTESERKEWLAGLKVGDEVVICGRRYDEPVIDRIERLTNTQIVLVKDSQRFRRADGNGIGSYGAFSYPRLHRVEASDRNAVTRRELSAYIRMIERKKDLLPIDKVRKLLAVLKELEQEIKE